LIIQAEPAGEKGGAGNHNTPSLNAEEPLSMSVRIVSFVAVVLTALMLVPLGAHFFEHWRKMALPRDAYFSVQTIYDGWAWFGGVIIAALLANATLAILLRGEPARALAAAAAVLIAASLAIFFVWTQPANAATDNWRHIPAGWEALRVQWEYSHVANAVVVFAALCCTTAAIAARH
jgi:hypothetical protein